MWFSPIALPYIWRNPVSCQYCPHTSAQLCKVHFNVTVPNSNDPWLLLFVGVRNEFGKFPEVGLNSLLAHQLLSTNIVVVIISQNIVLNRVQSQFLRCCDSRKHHCACKNFVLESLWLLVSRYFCIQLKTSQSLIFRMENCTWSLDRSF